MKALEKIGTLVMIIIYAAINFFVVETFNKGIISSFGVNILVYLSIVFFIGTVLGILVYLFTWINIGKVLGKIGTYALGVTIMSFTIIVITNLIGKIFGILEKRYFGLAQICIIIIVFIYGRYNASKTKRVTYDISIDKKSSLKGLKVALISDLHLGYFNDNNKLKRAINNINKEKAEVVLIPGDLFDSGFKGVQNPEKTKEILNSIKSKYGTFLTWGNHDSGKNFKEMKKFIEQTNITLLEDRVIKIEDKFTLVGRKDRRPIGYQGEKREAIKLEKEVNPVIVLEHQEPNFEEYRDIADLIVSGHTHRGQIFPFNIVTKIRFKNHYGYLKLKSGVQSITTSGLFTWGPPLRIGSYNEIVVINIKFA